MRKMPFFVQKEEVSWLELEGLWLYNSIMKIENQEWYKMKLGVVSAIYDGFVCIEVEDKAFESSKEKILDSITLSCRYLKQFVI